MLSILIPYYKFDCSQLIRELLAQASQLQNTVELLIADDGSQDPAINESLEKIIADKPIAVRWDIYSENVGRAAIRNSLLDNARADYVLFLDCDMLPDTDEFLSNYLTEIQQEPSAGAFVGGRSYKRLPALNKDQALYQHFSHRTECIPATQRKRNPSWYVFTNNIVVRREIFAKVNFDNDFSGWGFEDTDWGIRISNHAPIRHIDNTATHLGIITDLNLLEKYQESVPNFMRLLRKHPDEVLKMPITRWAQKLSHPVMLTSLSKALSSRIVRTQWLPLRIRFLSLQLYRASLYACELANPGASVPTSSN